MNAAARYFKIIRLLCQLRGNFDLAAQIEDRILCHPAPYPSVETKGAPADPSNCSSWARQSCTSNFFAMVPRATHHVLARCPKGTCEGVPPEIKKAKKNAAYSTHQ
mmetsp:Transcript_88654/g.141127  ORF Transcript_88654/g.141127 Transcript_88654/m.141127 type:complete len:106 (-) Transcript_88654:151-468(-)